MAFEDFYNKYYETVYYFILKRINHQQNAEDLAMDCFLSAYKKFSDFDSNKASYGTWLFVIVNNKLKNYYRDNKMSEEIDDNFMLLDDFSDEVIAAEYVSEMRETLYEALMSLNELQRRIVIYKFFYEKTSTQISELTGVPPASIRVQLSRCLKKIKGYFNKKGIEWEE